MKRRERGHRTKRRPVNGEEGGACGGERKGHCTRRRPGKGEEGASYQEKAWEWIGRGIAHGDDLGRERKGGIAPGEGLGRGRMGHRTRRRLRRGRGIAPRESLGMERRGHRTRRRPGKGKEVGHRTRRRPVNGEDGASHQEKAWEGR